MKGRIKNFANLNFAMFGLLYHYSIVLFVHVCVCFLMKIFLGSQHRSAHHKSAPNTPIGEYGDISALEKEKVTQCQ